MKFAKPQWNLATCLLPPIGLSLVFIIFFPSLIVPLLLGFLVLPIVPSLWLGLNSGYFSSGNQLEKVLPKISLSRWVLSVVGILFLLGISATAVIFLTSSSQLAPDELTFGKVTRTSSMIFPIGMCFLVAQITLAFFQAQKKIGQKTALSVELFRGFSGFTTLVMSASIVIFTMAAALTHLMDIEIQTGSQLQPILGAMALYLPLIMNRSRKKNLPNDLKKGVNPLFKQSGLLICAIIVLTILTLPLPNIPIKLLFIQYGLSDIQWKLFILAWWIGITPLLATQIIRLSLGRSFFQILLVLFLGSDLVYLCSSQFLSGALDYFLAILHRDSVVLILSALPLAILTLNAMQFQDAMEIPLVSRDPRKPERDKKYFFHALIKGTTIACGLYWVSGLALLSPLLLMVAIPSLILFLLVGFGEVFFRRSQRLSEKVKSA